VNDDDIEMKKMGTGKLLEKFLTLNNQNKRRFQILPYLILLLKDSKIVDYMGCFCVSLQVFGVDEWAAEFEEI
jgi:hypothetical protein